MPQIQQGELVDYSTEIEHTLRSARHTIQLEMANNNSIIAVNKSEEGQQDPPLAAYTTSNNGEDYGGLRLTVDYLGAFKHSRPPVHAHNFEIKLNVIQMVQNNVQFDGLQEEDPSTQIANFLEVCDSFKINGVPNNTFRLRIFPFSLRGKAKSWLKSLPSGSITSWDSSAKSF